MKIERPQHLQITMPALQIEVAKLDQLRAKGHLEVAQRKHNLLTNKVLRSQQLGIIMRQRDKRSQQSFMLNTNVHQNV